MIEIVITVYIPLAFNGAKWVQRIVGRVSPFHERYGQNDEGWRNRRMPRLLAMNHAVKITYQ